MNENYETAAFEARVKAGAVDFAIPILFWLLLASVDFPVIGILFCSAYILLRDSLDGESIGKKWQNLRAINIETQRPCQWRDSILRNLFVFLPLIGPLIALVELYYAFQDSEYRRFGDQFANTLVVKNYIHEPAETRETSAVLEASGEPDSLR